MMQYRTSQPGNLAAHALLHLPKQSSSPAHFPAASTHFWVHGRILAHEQPCDFHFCFSSSQQVLPAAVHSAEPQRSMAVRHDCLQTPVFFAQSARHASSLHALRQLSQVLPQESSQARHVLPHALRHSSPFWRHGL